MTRYIFRKRRVYDGLEMDIPTNAIAVSLYTSVSKPVEIAVVWLEPQEKRDENV